MSPAELSPAELSPAELSPGDALYTTISLGDRAWWTGDRETAAHHWRTTLDRADDDPAPEARAAEAMVRIRLLRVEGNLAPLWHERALHEALDACPREVAWCLLAEADFHLWMPAFTGADPAEALALAAPGGVLDAALPGPAAARRILAGSPESLAGFGSERLDGIGQGLTEHRGWPRDPGTWVLGLGVAAAPGLGVGGAVHFEHPDLAWDDHDLRVDLSVSSRGSVALASTLRLELPGRPRGWLGLSHGPLDNYALPLTLVLDTATLGLGGGVSAGGGSATLGLVGRVDRIDPGAGPNTGTAWATGDTLARLGPWMRVGAGPLGLWAETGFGAYPWVLAGLDLRGERRLGEFRLRWHGLADVAPLAEGPDAETGEGSPWWLWPSAGGSALLRGLPAGAWRDAARVGAQAELHRPLVGPLVGVVFVDGAALGPLGPWGADVFHATAGLGLRLVLPPNEQNITRLDVGVGEGRVGVVLGWGEAW